MNTDYFAQQIAVEIKAGFAQADLANVKAKITMAAAIGKEEATVETKYPLSGQFIDDLADYGISCIEVDGNNKYVFRFGKVEV